MTISIASAARPFIGDETFEVVERKGLGHPDTLADEIANSISRAYTTYCLEHFGRMAHHWFDKVLLLGGESDVDFGYGKILQPFTVQVAGKATLAVGGEAIPIQDIAADAARSVLRDRLYKFDAEQGARVVLSLNDNVGAGRKANRYRPKTVDDLPSPQSRLIANDTVNCAGFYGLSDLERLVLSTELYLNSSDFKSQFPYTGMDIKLIGIRRGAGTQLIVRLPFIGELTPNRTVYLERKRIIQDRITEFAAEAGFDGLQLFLNSDDDIGASYLTVSGTVADTGDHGVVGRGNRANGLITPGRPMNIEAPAGKNPVDHVGKLYTEASARMSRAVHEATGVNVNVTLVTERGNDLREPAACLVEYFGSTWDASRTDDVRALCERHLSEIPLLGHEFLDKSSWITG